MSIIIKGMDMPKSCGECKFFSGLGYGFHCFLNGKHITFIGEIQDDCPLIEIPTPHGRLIDDVKKIIAQIEPCMLIATTYDEQVKRAEAVKEWLLSILEAED